MHNSTRMPTSRIMTMLAITRAMSDSSRPWLSNCPKPMPSAGAKAINSAAINERHAKAHPCRSPAK